MLKKLDKKSFIRENWLIIAALIYVLSPLDILPDFLLPAGFGDDILVILLTLVKKYHDFKKSEKVKETIIEGEIINE